jgi:hypothetical protein
MGMQWEYNQLTVVIMLQWINYNLLPLVLNTAQRIPWSVRSSLTSDKFDLGASTPMVLGSKVVTLFFCNWWLFPYVFVARVSYPVV